MRSGSCRSTPVEQFVDRALPETGELLVRLGVPVGAGVPCRFEFGAYEEVLSGGLQLSSNDVEGFQDNGHAFACVLFIQQFEQRQSARRR